MCSKFVCMQTSNVRKHNPIVSKYPMLITLSKYFKITYSIVSFQFKLIDFLYKEKTEIYM